MNYKIIGKYIKNLKFEIPKAKTFFLLSKDISNYKINIDINSNQFKDKIVEVETRLRLIPTNNDFEKINTEIIYSAIIELDGEISDKEKIEEIILIKVPNEIYPNIRKLFVSLFEESGFKDIKIDKAVNFRELYNKRRIQ
jgi:protein-export chaperone SecB